jgi:hypothetical protein
MAPGTFEAVSARDSAFLVFEAAHAHMYHGGVAIFDAGALRTPDGGIDVPRIRGHVAAHLGCASRHRQRLAFAPVFNTPVWVDDPHFNLRYHVRHTALSRPGDERQLKEECARIMSQQLDRGKPLWEMWIIEGLARRPHARGVSAGPPVREPGLGPCALQLRACAFRSVP